jgi:ribosome-associated translation inhibitor RaiA
MFATFSFSGFKPKIDLELYANVMLFQITDHLVNKFTTVGKLSKVEKKYICSFKVYLPRKAFFEETESEDPKTALDNANQNIQKRISDYNAMRFQISSSNFLLRLVSSIDTTLQRLK